MEDVEAGLDGVSAVDVGGGVVEEEGVDGEFGGGEGGGGDGDGGLNDVKGFWMERMEVRQRRETLRREARGFARALERVVGFWNGNRYFWKNGVMMRVLVVCGGGGNVNHQHQGKKS